MYDPSLQEAKDDLDNWYEKALAMGYGFKSDEERNNYIASLGKFLSDMLYYIR